MKPSPLVHWLRVSVMLALCSFTAYACGGGKFSATGGDGGTSSGGSTGEGGSAANAGSTVVNKVACEGPEDCDDGDACTVDQCGADGFCARTPKCDANEKCCNGSCGQCCSTDDCDDGVACTLDLCFDGGCSHSPDNTKCGDNEYCSALTGCKLKEACLDAAGCDDSDACTDDACTTSLCDHTATKCASGQICCPGAGCAECCEDSQCNDGNPCTRDSCSANKCSHDSFCGEGTECCPSADKTSATCGACCSASECDDGVKCTKDTCTQGTCASTPDDKNCNSGFACDPKNDCYQTAECLKDTDCKPTGCQVTGKCVTGKCAYTNCDKGTKCCGDSCKACCANTDCNDGIACTDDVCKEGVCSNTPNNGSCTTGIKACDPSSGGCIDCKSNSDCNDGSDCTADVCDLTTHKCSNKATVCAAKGLLCCGTTCAACCGDSDCQGGVVQEAAIGTKCTYQGCTAGTCGPKSTLCSVGIGCCSYGCCGIKGPTPPPSPQAN